MTQRKITPKDFCIWLKGFVDASHHWNLTPEAWDTVKTALSTVKYEDEVGYRYEHTNASAWTGNQTTTLGPKKEQLND